MSRRLIRETSTMRVRRSSGSSSRSWTYGPGGYDRGKPGDNIVSRCEVPDEPEPVE